jgi:hypothetical protein
MKHKPFIVVDGVRKLFPPDPFYATWCAGCRDTVELVRIDEAARIAGTDADEVITRAAAGEIHLGLRPEALLFCVNSLVATAPRASRRASVAAHWN